MARIKLSPILTQASGSIGGITLQRNKYGMTMRQKPLPINPSSSAQYVIRQHIITLQKAWQDLTDAQRLQWDRFPDFSGQSIARDRSVKISGHALYIKYQLMRLMSGIPLLTTIAYNVMPELPVFGKVYEAAGSLYVDFNFIVDHDEYFFLFSGSSPRPPARKFSPRGIRFMKVSYQANTYYHLTNQYIAAFGAIPVIGDTIHVLLQWFSITAPVYGGIYRLVTEIDV